MTSPSRTAGPDRWQHYGASPRGRRSLSRLHWDWYQLIGPGAELLGDLTGRTVAELGSGPGHQAAYVATELKAVRVIAIDSSTAQHSRGRDLYEDVPGRCLGVTAKDNGRQRPFALKWGLLVNSPRE